MKKLLLMMCLSLCATGYAKTETTVYYAVPSSVVGNYTVKLNANFKGDGDDWHQFNMTKTYKTYLGGDIYTCTFTDEYDGVGCIQFQLYNGDKWESQKNAITSWTFATVYNGKMWIHDDTWHDYADDDTMSPRSVIYHVKKTDSWTPTNAYTFVGAFNNGWPGEAISQNSLNNSWYDYTVTKPFSKIIFDNGTLENSTGGVDQTWDITIGADGEYWVENGPTSSQATTTAPEGWRGYTRSVTSGNFGTICLPFAATVTGATVYTITSKVMDGETLKGINLTSVEGELTAGQAYIFKATGETLTATYSGSYTSATEANGMMGNLGSTDVNVPQYNYVVGTDNLIHKVTGDEVTCGQYKAYITLSNVSVASARGAHFIGFDEEATGIENVKAENGQETVYNLNGQRVAGSHKGLLIVNGKKLIKK